MSIDSNEDSDRWEELQVTRLLFGLSQEEQLEFDELTRQATRNTDDSLDKAVASLDMAWSNQQPEHLPEHLKQAIQARAEQELASKRVVSLGEPSSREYSRFQTASYLPWLVSAACLAFALFSWFATGPIEDAQPDLAKRRATLLADDRESVQVEWSPGTTPVAGATGDVVWSTSQQQGYMRFRGLPVNMPSKEQYQLWIFDKNQSEATPIDGGVFDIASTEETIIPIDAKLRVQQPYLFAVTIEKPGGVVVSSRERLPLLAKVE
ncbi:Anti-sigma-K factor rskA [Bremerella volcania]|uniref:Anti-sigma-K factor rskA n=1 Tax=Bremerella volcania TaxID=2527984 RepID=A0A518CC63_9BACT|nr:anti-sigma factor [Bremerella volcania]QDU76811.1 Anti-sigma-K factor rskA [Bremerella volcania]